MRTIIQSPFMRATAAIALLACSDSGQAVTPPQPDAPTQQTADAPPPGTPGVLKRSSRSSTIAISDDDRVVVMVNPQNDSVTVFKTADLSRTIVPTGKEPRAVVIGPDGTTAYVANTGDATVVKITNIDSSPQIAGTATVGSEPTGLALSPTGARLFVAAFAEGEIDVLDTATMNEGHAPIKGNISHPYGIAVTNNGNPDDSDELLIVPEFYGEVVPAAAVDARMLDQSHVGRVRVYSLATLDAQPSIELAPHDTHIAPGGAGNSVFASPNQLRSVFVRRDGTHPEDNTKVRLYMTSVAAAPQPPTRFDGDTFPFVYVADLGTGNEVTTGDGTTNLADKILHVLEPKDQNTGKFFMAELYDISFTTSGSSDGSVAYMVGQGADAVQRVTFTGNDAVLGSVANNQIDVIGDAKTLHAGCKGPNGIVVANDNNKAYLNCWTSQTLGVVSLGNDQKLVDSKQAFDPVMANASIDRGRRFYFTGRARWSGDGTGTTAPTNNGIAWKSCGGCHPNGLSDNITWIFGTGPRQSTSMDGTFSHFGAGEPKQRALNWTAVNDEIHDFERNTRTTAGGLGAITTAADPADCGTLGKETRQTLLGELAQPVVTFQDNAGNCQHDWDDIEAWVKTIRPPAALKHLDATKVARGEALFTGAGACVQCHAGAGWTISRRPYDVRAAGIDMAAIANTVFSGGAPWPVAWNNHTKQIELEQPGNVALVEISCVIRNLLGVGVANTFGPAALELKPNLTDVAEGNSGFNVPSLYGLSLGAPYLHDGLASSLDDLLANFPGHTRAGNENFEPTADDREALAQYLLSIDAQKPEVSVATGFDKCVQLP